MKVNNRVQVVLQNSLRDLPGLKIASSKKSSMEGGLDFQVGWKGADTKYKLTVLWAREGWPSDVYQVLTNVPHPWPRKMVIAANVLSPGALDLLKKRDANWVDEAGNIHLRVPPGLIIVKTATEKERKKVATFAWSPSSIVVAEYMLMHREEKYILREVADRTGWSTPQVSNVMRGFDGKGWTTRHGPPRGGGVLRELTNPGSLLDAWSAHLVEHRPKRKLGHKLMRDPVRFLAEYLVPVLDKLGKWAITGWAGLELVAPYANIVPSLQIYLPTDQLYRKSSEIFETAKIREVEDGGNIEFWEMDEPLIVADQVSSDVPVINLPRLYSDLISIGGRAKDGADHLRETQIGY